MDNVNINDILSSLSNEDIEMLKGVAGSILTNPTRSPQLNSKSRPNQRRNPHRRTGSHCRRKLMGLISIPTILQWLWKQNQFLTEWIKHRRKTPI